MCGVFIRKAGRGIPLFTSFSHISFFHLAEPKFYATFYEELFRRFKDWDDLPAVWRQNKRKDAQWLAARLREQAALRPEGSGPLRVLSIGSGVGYMEHCLVEEMSADELELHVNEPSTVSMRWLRRHVPNERMYIGMPPACLPPDVFYDVIYLSAVDYSIPTRELQHLLGELRAQLVPGGQLICLSASLLQEDSFIGSFVNALKIVIRGFLHFFGHPPPAVLGLAPYPRRIPGAAAQGGFPPSGRRLAGRRLRDLLDTRLLALPKTRPLHDPGCACRVRDIFFPAGTGQGRAYGKVGAEILGQA